MAPGLHRDLIVDILCRVPAKDLLRFRSVCKAWRSLIDGHDFIKLHFNHLLQTSSTIGLVLLCDNDVYWVNGLDTFGPAQRLDHPLRGGGRIELVGCCNGLIALRNRRGDMAVGNPSTQRYRTFPFSDEKQPNYPGYHPLGITGFGYDPTSDDYKLFRMVKVGERCFIAQDFKNGADIYSMKAKVWKRSNNILDCYFFRRRNHALVCNALHWLCVQPLRQLVGIHGFQSTIVAFDLVTEDYREVPLPDSDREKEELVELGGCLCLVCMDKLGYRKPDTAEIWVMKEYGVKESWTKLFTLKPSDGIGSFNYMIPFAYLKGGEQVLLDQDGDKFILYDLVSKRAENISTPDIPKRRCTRVCVRSLVGLGESYEEDTPKQDKKNGDGIEKEKLNGAVI